MKGGTKHQQLGVFNVGLVTGVIWGKGDYGGHKGWGSKALGWGEVALGVRALSLLAR